ncbi:uroporphyrinogen-III synthase [Saccharopolyspora griseoalba]|uniref:Uroporphyrinogen-III synthase n=1 Tax=Saccharopolyspora griseoalba TaxID=1431848 RepID=A0ABW2LH67_9PSEU
MSGELAGFTIGVTAARRAEEFGSLLESRGARVVHGPALRLLPLSDDAELRRASEECITDPPDAVVATTGIGFRGWVEAADGWGIGADLIEALRHGRLLARGPKARGALRTAGLPEPWSPGSESSAELLDHLLDGPLDGARVAVQLHGQPLPHFVEALRCAGAEVIEVPVYRWTAPADPTALENLLGAVRAHQLDAVTFTSAPAAAGFIEMAGSRGNRDEVLAALRGPVLAACVGPVARAPLAAANVPSVLPPRYRIGALVRALCEELPKRSPALPVAGRELQVRGHAVLLDDEIRPISPQGITLLRALADEPGRVVSRRDLAEALRCAGGSADEHAVEQAVARLRSALGAPQLVQTVIKRGYRLPLEPMREPPRCAEPS